ncbi:MAG: hypothetical protein ACKO34_07425 [Vampirovibrionales bacterium]
MMMMAVSSVSSTPAPVVPTPATKPTVASNTSKPAESLESLTPDELQLLNLLLASGDGDTVELSTVKNNTGDHIGVIALGKGDEAKAPVASKASASSKKEATKKDVKTTDEAKPSKVEESNKKAGKSVNFVA